MTTRFALDQYAFYVCDRCGDQIGQAGQVTLRRGIVWSCLCDRCIRELIEEEPPQDRLYIDGERIK